MRKGINLKKRHRHSGKGGELYFVPRAEPSSISPTTSTSSGLDGDLLYLLMYFGLVEVKCYEKCTH